MSGESLTRSELLGLLEDIGRALQSSRRIEAPGEATGFEFDRRIGVYPAPGNRFGGSLRTRG